MRERISALMDGELPEAELSRDLANLKNNADLRRAWDTYHLIGDTIRGHAAPALADLVSKRLAAEPTVLAPRRRTRRLGIAQLALSAAAGVAGISLVAWLAVQGLNPAPQQLAVSAPPAASAGAPATASAAAPLSAEAESYLLAHQNYSPAGAMQGVAPYVRTVAAERNPRAK